jgi:hypothetical protein
MTNDGSVRREIKLGAHQTKGSKGPTVVLSTRARDEIGSFWKSRVRGMDDSPLVASQRNGRPFSAVSLSMVFKEIYDFEGIRTPRTLEGGPLRRG